MPSSDDFIHFITKYWIFVALIGLGGFLAHMIQQLTSIFNWDKRKREILSQITKGFPETTRPQFPEFMNQGAYWKKLIKVNGCERVGQFYSEDMTSYQLNVNLLRSVTAKVVADFGYAQGCHAIDSRLMWKKMQVFGLSMNNFKVGDKVQEFALMDDFVTPKDAYYTYEWLSSAIQCTYYNEDGQKYLAGICLYSDGYGAAFLKSNEALFALAQLSAEPYPLQDRNKRLDKMGLKRYGRYCRKARKTVTVDCCQSLMAIRHLDYDHFESRYVFEECYDCFKDAMKYSWEGYGNEYPTFTTPSLFIPKVLIHTNTWNVITTDEGRPIIGLAMTAKHLQWVDANSLEMIRRKLRSMFRKYEKISKYFEEELTRNTIAVSFAEYNFQIGKHFQDFKPVDTIRVSKYAYYTHRKISDTIQATYLIDKNVEYLAGICYFPVLNHEDKNLRRDRAQIHLTRMSAEALPRQARMESFNYKYYKRYGRWCGGRRVTVDCTKGTCCHVEFDVETNDYKMVPCEECNKEAMQYSWDKEKGNQDEDEERVRIKCRVVNKSEAMKLKARPKTDEIASTNYASEELQRNLTKYGMDGNLFSTSDMFMYNHQADEKTPISVLDCEVAEMQRFLTEREEEKSLWPETTAPGVVKKTNDIPRFSYAAQKAEEDEQKLLDEINSSELMEYFGSTTQQNDEMEVHSKTEDIYIPTWYKKQNPKKLSKIKVKAAKKSVQDSFPQVFRTISGLEIRPSTSETPRVHRNYSSIPKVGKTFHRSPTKETEHIYAVPDATPKAPRLSAELPWTPNFPREMENLRSEPATARTSNDKCQFSDDECCEKFKEEHKQLLGDAISSVSKNWESQLTADTAEFWAGVFKKDSEMSPTESEELVERLRNEMREISRKAWRGEIPVTYGKPETPILTQSSVSSSEASMYLEEESSAPVLPERSPSSPIHSTSSDSEYEKMDTPSDDDYEIVM